MSTLKHVSHTKNTLTFSKLSFVQRLSQEELSETCTQLDKREEIPTGVSVNI